MAHQVRIARPADRHAPRRRREIVIRISSRRARLAIILAAVLFIASIAAIAVATNPGFSTVSQPGSMILPTCYTAFTDGSSFFLRDGNTGQIVTSSATAATVLQAGLNSITAQTILNGGCGMQIKTGVYNIGPTHLTMTGGPLNWSLSFEAGAEVIYSGSDYALNFTGTSRGNLNRWTIAGPFIKTTGGSPKGALYLSNIYIGTITKPMITVSQGIGINLDNADWSRVIGGGEIIVDPSSPARPAGSIGILLGNTTNTGHVEISVDGVKYFETGIQFGNSAQNHQNYGAVVEGVGFIYNKNAILLYSISGLLIEGNYFELQTFADIRVISPSSSVSPEDVQIIGNTFVEVSNFPCIYIPDGNYVYDLYEVGNKMVFCTLVISNVVIGGTVDVTRVNRVYNNGTRVTLTMQPNPQVGKVASISTATATKVNGHVNFDSQYPTGCLPEVFLTPNNPTSSAVIFGGTWASNVTTSGFDWNLEVTNAVGGSTVTLDWQVVLY